MNLLTIATLNLEDGAALDCCPVSSAGGRDERDHQARAAVPYRPAPDTGRGSRGGEGLSCAQAARARLSWEGAGP